MEVVGAKYTKDNHTGRGILSAENKLEIENKEQVTLTETSKGRPITGDTVEYKSEPYVGEGKAKLCINVLHKFEMKMLLVSSQKKYS